MWKNFLNLTKFLVEIMIKSYQTGFVKESKRKSQFSTSSSDKLDKNEVKKVLRS
jgi:hypothetical protein